MLRPQLPLLRIMRTATQATGKCYENCGRFIMLARAGWTLCHGTALGRAGNAEGIWYGHAWLERDGQALDLESRCICS